MKRLNTLLLALTISTAPVLQISADMSLSMSIPRSSFSTAPLFKMSPTTQNVLKGVGIGVSVFAIGYCLYQYFRPLTDQEFIEKVRQDRETISARFEQVQETDHIDLRIDYLNGTTLYAELCSVGRKAELTWRNSFWANDDNHLSSYCAVQAPLLRAAAIARQDLKMLQDDLNELNNRMRQRPGEPFNDTQVYLLEALRKKLQSIVNVFELGLRTTHEKELKDYAQTLAKKRHEEKKLRLQEAKVAAALEQARQTGKIAEAINSHR